MDSVPVLTYINDYGARMPLYSNAPATTARWMKSRAAKADAGGTYESQVFSGRGATGTGRWGVSGLAVAGSDIKQVDLTLESWSMARRRAP